MDNKRFWQLRRLKYKKILKEARTIFKSWDVRLGNEVYIWYFYPAEYMIVTLWMERVYILRLRLFHGEIDQFAMEWRAFNGYGPNGVLIF